MLIIAIIGKKRSGKITLIEEIIKKLSPKVRIAVIKHIHHKGVEFDVKGTDTWRAKHAGALISIGVAPDALFLTAKIEKQDLNLAKNIVKTIAPQINLILLEGFYNQIKEREDIKRIIVVRNIEEINELTSDKIKPLAVFCSTCNNKEKVPIYNNANDLITEIENLIRSGEQ